MNVRTLRVAGALLAALFGVWAGLRVYSLHVPQPVAASPQARGVRVPVGEASPPTASDVDRAPGTGEVTDPGELEAGMAAPAKIPDRLPAFSLSGRDGKATSIATWNGKSLILNFWATWCAPCRREIPLLQSLHGEWAGRDVQVIGIAVDYRDKVLKYADDLKISYPLLIGEQDALDVAAAFGMRSPVFPFTVFTDRRGQVVALYIGELHKQQADLILSVVQNLNQDKMPLAEARQSIAAGLQALTAHPG